MNVIDRFAAVGVRFRLHGDDKVAAKVSGPLTDELRDQLAAAKDQVLVELQAQEDRRRRVLAMLAEHPTRKYAMVYDPDASPDYDVLTVAIPDASFEMRLPKPADAMNRTMRLLETLERHYPPTDTDIGEVGGRSLKEPTR